LAALSLRRRSQKSRRIGWPEFETLTARSNSAHHSHMGAGADMTPVTLREEPGAGDPPARICEGKAEWPSYSTTTYNEAKRQA
jgi:hypothetical protein